MKRRLHFTGTYTALITPFKNGAVAYDELRRFIEFQIKGGVDGLVPVGTTGESPTVDNAEHLEIIRTTVEAARGRVPVIAGTGSNSTKEACDMTRTRRTTSVRTECCSSRLIITVRRRRKFTNISQRSPRRPTSL